METLPVDLTARVFQTLMRGRTTEREIVQSQLLAGDPRINVELLRRWLLEALRGEFSADNASNSAGSWKAWARTWMLNSLGRIANGDAEAEKYVRDHTRA